MGMIVYPCLSLDLVRNGLGLFAEMPAVFREQDKRFVKNEVRNAILLAVCSVIRIRSRFAVFCGYRLSQMIQKFDNFAKLDSWPLTIELSAIYHFSIPRSCFMPWVISFSMLSNSSRIACGGRWSTSSWTTSL